MKKNAFTFVELLAVITILGVLALLTTPIVDKSLKNSKNKVYQKQLDNIVIALRNWASDNKQLLPTKENDTLTITLSQLKQDGYIELDISNTNTGKCFDNAMQLVITRYKNTYNYEINKSTIKDTKTCDVDLNRPRIILNGSSIMNIEVNSNYSDLGVVAKDKDGNDITSKVTTSITGSGSYVDTSSLRSSYVITYRVEDGGKSASISRTVNIVDTTVPNLIVPGNITIDTSVKSFDALEGVSVSDNSGENIKVNVKSNITFGIVGKYTIEYSATDSSGNRATVKRIVEINKPLTLSELVTTNSSLGVTSINACVNSGTCSVGTPFAIKVNKKETYKFYVIKDDGNKVTMIMNKNIGDSVPWITEDDYIKAGGTNWQVNPTYPGATEKGPLTALAYLKKQTDGWTNIPSMSYTLTDANNNYQPISISSVKARMLTYAEAAGFGCGGYDGTDSTLRTCPSWLYADESNSFYTTSSLNDWIVHEVYCSSTLNAISVPMVRFVRPVIEVSRSL